MMSSNSIYPTVLEAGKSGNTIFLDLGCCSMCRYLGPVSTQNLICSISPWPTLVGTDVRKLVLDGYPPQNVLGSDIRQDFIDLSHHLYQDSATNSIRFFTSDIFEVDPHPSSLITKSPDVTVVDTSQITTLEQLRGRIDHFYTGALFHLFDEKTQYALALRIASLLKREPGSVVFGRHVGLASPGLIDDHMKRLV